MLKLTFADAMSLTRNTLVCCLVLRSCRKKKKSSSLPPPSPPSVSPAILALFSCFPRTESRLTFFFMSRYAPPPPSFRACFPCQPVSLRIPAETLLESLIHQKEATLASRQKMEVSRRSARRGFDTQQQQQQQQQPSLLRQYLYLCTSKARKLSTCASGVRDAAAAAAKSERSGPPPPSE
jgi:hypothetical protein